MAIAEDPKLPPATDRKVDFVKDVQPIFAARCYECHGPKKQESAFRLDHKGTALHGGEIGTAIVPGKSAESPLVKYVAGVEKDLKMPPKGDPLTAEQVGIIRAWIDQGAEWPDSASVTLDLRAKTTGRSKLRCVPRCRRLATRIGPRRPSTASSWPGWRRRS